MRVTCVLQGLNDDFDLYNIYNIYNCFAHS